MQIYRLGHCQCTQTDHNYDSTGVKCLPASDIPSAKGNILHDWHAEVLAIRAFNRFLIQECHDLAANVKKQSNVIKWREQSARTSEAGLQPFAIRGGIRIYMYCSEAPCGDASMELVSEAQADNTPWSPSVTEKDGLLGRGFFGKLGVVRRKPGQYRLIQCLG